MKELKALKGALDQSHAIIWFRPDGTILDEKGHAVKVVKYTTDITALVRARTQYRQGD